MTCDPQVSAAKLSFSHAHGGWWPHDPWHFVKRPFFNTTAGLCAAVADHRKTFIEIISEFGYLIHKISFTKRFSLSLSLLSDSTILFLPKSITINYFSFFLFFFYIDSKLSDQSLTLSFIYYLAFLLLWRHWSQSSELATEVSSVLKKKIIILLNIVKFNFQFNA